LGKILFWKRKKKKYSLIPLLRIYEELAKQELKANKRRNIQYIYIQEPREYFFDKTKITECEEKSIWDIDLPIINNKLLRERSLGINYFYLFQTFK